MRIQSNIKGVIGQMERLIRHVPVASQRALAPERWQGVAYGTAERTLAALATEDRKRFIPFFMQTLAVAPIDPAGLSLALSRPRREVLRLPESVLGPEHALPGGTGKFQPGRIFDMPVPEFKELIKAWVETPTEEGGKDWTGRDTTLGADKVAENVAGVMLSPNAEAQAGRRALLPHIIEWMQRQLG